MYLALGFTLCFGLCQYGLLGIFGFSFFPDEFGYWAPAAKLLGWDWSGTASLGSYYSFGYSLLLTPILYLVEDSILAYRTAVFLNMIFMCIGLCLMTGLLKRLFTDLDEKCAVLIASVAVISPAWIFYMQTTMTEALLLSCTLAVCYLFLRFLEKPGAVSAILLALLLIYIYSVHMRAIGMVAAAVVVLIFRAVRDRDGMQRRRILIALLMTALLFAVAIAVKNGLLERLYDNASAETLRVNDYAGQWRKLKLLLSPKGLLAFVQGVAAKLLYLGASTWGLAYLGLWKAGHAAVSCLRKKRMAEPKDDFWLFWFLAAVAQILVAVIYTLESAEPGAERLDLFVHGRYDELIIPLLMACGLNQLLDSHRRWLAMGLSAAGMLLFTLSSVLAVRRSGMAGVHGYFIIGMSYLLDEENFHPIPFLWAAVGLSCLMMLAVTVTASIARRRGWTKGFLTACLLLQILCGMHVSQHYIYIGNSYGYGDVRMADKVLEVAGQREASEAESGRIIHLYEGGTPYIEQVQFRLRDIQVEILDASEDALPYGLSPQDLVILQEGSKWEGLLSRLYDRSWRSGHLSLYYNE